MSASHTFPIYGGEIENLAKQLVEKVGDIITKVKSAEQFREYTASISVIYESICTVSCEAVAATTESKVKHGILSELRQLGGSTIRLIESIRVSSGKSAADHVSRLKLGQAGRDVSSSVSSLIAAAKEGGYLIECICYLLVILI